LEGKHYLSDDGFLAIAFHGGDSTQILPHSGHTQNNVNFLDPELPSTLPRLLGISIESCSSKALAS
jgi:hypothetical protein